MDGGKRPLSGWSRVHFWVALCGTAEAVPFPVKVKITVKSKIKVKDIGQECPTHTGKVKGSGRGAPALHSLRELDAVLLVEEGPGFAVGVVEVGLAAALGA